jgi:hypothetical protein
VSGRPWTDLVHRLNGSSRRLVAGEDPGQRVSSRRECVAAGDSQWRGWKNESGAFLADREGERYFLGAGEGEREDSKVWWAG